MMTTRPAPDTGELAELRARLIAEATRAAQEPREDEPASAPRTDWKWWEFFALPHA